MMKQKLWNIFLYLILGLLWCAILFLVDFIRIFDTFLDRFGNGVLLRVFVIISVIGFVVTLLCRKRMKYQWMLPLFLIVSTIVTTAVNYGVLYAASDYMSVYTREKWDKYPLVRYCMLDNLKEQYAFIDMTEQELKEILGEPDSIIEYTGSTKYKGYTAYQYIIGDDKIDGYTYDFIFDDGIVVDTAVSQL